MVRMMVLINLFFAPLVCLYWIYKKKGIPIVKSLELLFQYCIVTASNIPLAKAFTVLIKKVTGIQVFLDSGYYTVAALLSAVCIAWVYLNVRIEFVTEKAVPEDEEEPIM